MDNWKRKSALCLAGLLCVGLLSACDVKIDIHIDPQTQEPQQTQQTQQTVQPRPTPTAVSDISPDEPQAGLYLLHAEQETEELCAALGVQDTPLGPGAFAEVYGTDAIVYRCAGGSFYARYNGLLERLNGFYLAQDRLNGQEIWTCASYPGGWAMLTHPMPAQDVPQECVPIPGYAVKEKAAVLYLLDNDGAVRSAYAVPSPETGVYGFYLRVVGEYLSVGVGKNERVLLSLLTGNVFRAGELEAENIVAVSEELILYAQPSEAEGQRRIQTYDIAGNMLGETEASSWLSVSALPDGTVILSRSITEEVDMRQDIHSYPISVLTEEYTFEEIAPVNYVYDRIRSALAMYEKEGRRYHVNQFIVEPVSRTHCRVLCDLTVFQGEKLLSHCDYALFTMELP